MRRYHPGITEKRLCNKRFYKTEEAILKAFFVGGGYVGTTEMATRAGVARSTFYRHHQAVGKIMGDYRRYILEKYGRLVKNLLRNRRTTMRMLYAQTLAFIVQHRRIFKILLMGNEHSVFVRMIFKMQPKLVTTMRLPKNSERIFLVYTGEVVALLDKWCQNGAPEEEMGRLLNEIMFLTETARVRLKMLL